MKLQLILLDDLFYRGTGSQGVAGPQDPKGDSGPATIEVGITETVEPDTESLVTNVGTNQ